MTTRTPEVLGGLTIGIRRDRVAGSGPSESVPAVGCPAASNFAAGVVFVAASVFASVASDFAAAASVVAASVFAAVAAVSAVAAFPAAASPLGVVGAEAEVVSGRGRESASSGPEAGRGAESAVTGDSKSRAATSAEDPPKPAASNDSCPAEDPPVPPDCGAASPDWEAASASAGSAMTGIAPVERSPSIDRPCSRR